MIFDRGRRVTSGGEAPRDDTDRAIILFLAGDVMTGRGVDQVFQRSTDPALHERWVRSARRYVRLAEEASGPIPVPVDPAYVWGDGLDELERIRPDLGIVNLETAVTTHDEPWPGKGIHYRMHPQNVACLTAAGIDCCVLANNHVLDWGRAGLRESLETLHRAGIRTAGAGAAREEARAPAVLRAGRTRALIFALASPTAGVPREWAATAREPGVNLLPDLSEDTARHLAREIRRTREEGDVVVVSVHWGPNWGYRVPERQRRFARLLVEEGGVDVLHGHSSHHPRGIEVHRGRPVLYGCGDLINDYEGISGHEAFRPELTLMYFLTLDARSGRLLKLEMSPMEVRRFRLRRASSEQAAWLRDRLHRECRKLGAGVDLEDSGRLLLGPRL